MNIVDIRDNIYRAINTYFTNANIIWAEHTATRPKLPLITLRMRNTSRKLHPCEDDNGVRVYACTSKLEVNLYTKGREIKVNNVSIGNSINTATSDMMEFVNYMLSDDVVDYFTSNDIAVQTDGTVLDLTELENESQFVFRAMCEFDITFTEYATGRYGQDSVAIIPNASGGGTTTLQSPTQTIELVEINKPIEEDT